MLHACVPCGSFCSMQSYVPQYICVCVGGGGKLSYSYSFWQFQSIGTLLCHNLPSLSRKCGVVMLEGHVLTYVCRNRSNNQVKIRNLHEIILKSEKISLYMFSSVETFTGFLVLLNELVFTMSTLGSRYLSIWGIATGNPHGVGLEPPCCVAWYVANVYMWWWKSGLLSW